MIERCPSCGYSLTGLPDVHRCPECSLEYVKESRAVRWRCTHAIVALSIGSAITFIFGLAILCMRGTPSAALGTGVVLGGCLWRIRQSKTTIVISPNEVRVVRAGVADRRYPLETVARADRPFLSNHLRLIGYDDRLIGTIPGAMFNSLSRLDELAAELNCNIANLQEEMHQPADV